MRVSSLNVLGKRNQVLRVVHLLTLTHPVCQGGACWVRRVGDYERRTDLGKRGRWKPFGIYQLSGLDLKKRVKGNGEGNKKRHIELEQRELKLRLEVVLGRHNRTLKQHGVGMCVCV